jgi:hypothetical protein
MLQWPNFHDAVGDSAGCLRHDFRGLFQVGRFNYRKASHGQRGRHERTIVGLNPSVVVIADLDGSARYPHQNTFVPQLRVVSVGYVS